MKSASQKHIVQSECLPGSYDAIDIMKFIGAWMVVVIHTKPLQPYSAVWNTYTAEGICRIAVPFFFAVSGVFLYQKLERTTDRKQAFCICMRQSGRNFQMYFIWSVVYWIISLLHAGTVSRAVFAEQMRLFFCDASVYHFWYLVALIYGIPLMGIVFRWDRKYLGLLCVLPWIFRCIQFTYRWIPGGDRIPWTTLYWDSIRNTLSCAVPMMTIGIFCWQDHRKKTNCQWRNWTIIHAALNISELTLLYFLSPQKVHFEYLISMPALVYCFVNWLLTLKFRFQNREIPGMLRKASVWIYCSHVAFIVIFGWFHTSQGLGRFVVVAGGLAIATVLHVLPCYVKRKR